jgi:hypothetical protein
MCVLIIAASSSIVVGSFSIYLFIIESTIKSNVYRISECRGQGLAEKGCGYGYRMTSAAWKRRDAGMVRPRASAVVRLIYGSVVAFLM